MPALFALDQHKSERRQYLHPTLEVNHVTNIASASASQDTAATAQTNA